MRAAVLHGPDDLRIEDVAEPDGEVLVEVLAATACGTDRKMLARGHPILGPYPCCFGHETAGRRLDTGEPVFVGDSVACGACGPCARGRPQLCREMQWVLGGFAERIAAPEAALHRVPDGLDAAGAAMAEPLAACLHAVARGTDADRATVLGAGTIGLMLARLLVLQGRTVDVVDHHPERRAQADALGARGVAAAGRDAELIFEAAGRPEAWATAVSTVAPGGCVVLVGGCAGDVVLPAAPLHYDEVELRGAFHHSRAEVGRALDILASGDVDWRALAGEEVGLDDLPRALAAMSGGRAHKPVVRP